MKLIPCLIALLTLSSGAQAASAPHVWVSGGQLHVVTHWVSKARAATEANALLRIMERLLPSDWPGRAPTQMARAALP